MEASEAKRLKELEREHGVKEDAGRKPAQERRHRAARAVVTSGCVPGGRRASFGRCRGRRTGIGAKSQRARSRDCSSG
jgi:hypothetical protein